MNLIQRKISVYPPEDPRYVASLTEEIERYRQVTLEQIREVYETLVSAGTGELSVVGDFESQQVLPVVERVTAAWMPRVPFERLARQSVNNETGELVRVNTPDKAQATWVAAMTLPMRDDDPDYPALALGNFILGGGGLSSRLADRVRQKDGLSYTIQSALQPSAVDPRTVFFIFAICNPENSDRVHEAIHEELRKLLDSGITEKELTDAKNGYLQEQQVRRTADPSLAMILEVYRFIGRDMKYVAEFEDKLQQLTVADVNRALRKHLVPERLYTVSAGDFDQNTNEEASAK